MACAVAGLCGRPPPGLKVYESASANTTGSEDTFVLHIELYNTFCERAPETPPLVVQSHHRRVTVFWHPHVTMTLVAYCLTQFLGSGV